MLNFDSPLLSRQVLLVSARSCRAQVRGPSQARQRVWDRVDTRFVAFRCATSCSTFDALRRPKADDLRFDGIHTRHLPLELHQFLCWPCEHEVVTVCQARHSLLFAVKQIPRAESKLKSPVPDVLLPITFPTAGRVPRSVHALLRQLHFPIVGAHSVLHW